MGDVFFHRMIPFIDVSAGGSAKGYSAAIDAVIARVPPTSKIIPGHGEATDSPASRRPAVHRRRPGRGAKQAKAAGKTKEQFLASVDLPKYKAYDGYDERFKDNCAAAWDDDREVEPRTEALPPRRPGRRRTPIVPARAHAGSRGRCAGARARRGQRRSAALRPRASSRRRRAGSTCSRRREAGAPGSPSTCPGSVASDRPWPYDYSVEGEASSLEWFLDAREIRRAVLVGSSLGGAAAMLLAARRPERVAALVLVAAATAQTPIPWPARSSGRRFSASWRSRSRPARSVAIGLRRKIYARASSVTEDAIDDAWRPLTIPGTRRAALAAIRTDPKRFVGVEVADLGAHARRLGRGGPHDPRRGGADARGADPRRAPRADPRRGTPSAARATREVQCRGEKVLGEPAIRSGVIGMRFVGRPLRPPPSTVEVRPKQLREGRGRAPPLRRIEFSAIQFPHLAATRAVISRGSGGVSPRPSVCSVSWMIVLAV
jgi:pimeloyl-ACP methyl ester carboxylesterase